ncbi:MAG: tripartite tricarboxylate transporter substrate binding protein [Candidatus Protistobacter heckmanni]|nr:tripartite tricarboxylate transporter substrate binding protein [Candidatus Protistobacter heckmanni]
MLGRIVAQNLENALKRSVIVDNRPGAGSGIGAQLVAHSAPDGRTLLVATSTMLAINPSLYKSLSYQPQRDFAPVGLIAAVPLVVVVHPSVKANTLAELIALSKSKPGELHYASAGNGSPQHLCAEMFRTAVGINIGHVPYKGSALGLTDLLGGQVQMMFTDIAPALPYIRNVKLRALEVTTAERVPSLPEVGTVRESGLPGTAGFEAVAWQSLVAPAGTPKYFITQVNAELVKIINMPEVKERPIKEGMEPRTSTPEQLCAYIRSETERLAVAVKSSGASLD